MVSREAYACKMSCWRNVMNGNTNDNLRIVLEETDAKGRKKRRAPTYFSDDMNNEQNGSDFGEFVRRSFSATLRYFASKLLVSLIIAAVCFAVLSLLEVRLALLWALLAGVGNIIPVCGQWIGMAACVGGTWAVSGDWKTALYALLMLIVLQILDEFLLTPLLAGKATSIKPALIIIAMLVAGSFLGFWGVIFAVPIAATVKLAYEIFYLRRKKEK